MIDLMDGMIIEEAIDETKHSLTTLLFDIYWFELFLFALFLLLGFILEQKFKIDKPRKWFLAFNGVIFQRVLSVLAYYVPYIDILNTHVPLIADTHPFLIRIFLPNFIVASMSFIQKIPYLSFFYLFFGYGIFIRYKIPEDRLVRFNIMYGILILSFQGVFHELFLNFTDLFADDPIEKSEAALLMFLSWIVVLIPCFFRALSGKYEGNAFMREAIEVHLGRDGPDFIWWDRTRKDKAPKKPKL